MSSTKKMDAFLTKDISQMSYEELEKAARHYGLDEQSKVDLVQIDGLVGFPHCCIISFCILLLLYQFNCCGRSAGPHTNADV